jgi:hypothetical protein
MNTSLKTQKGGAYEKLRGDDKAEFDNAEVLRRAILFNRATFCGPGGNSKEKGFSAMETTFDQCALIRPPRPELKVHRGEDSLSKARHCANRCGARD